jgi:hypothetical protein
MHPPSWRQKFQRKKLPAKSIIVKQTPQNQNSVQSRSTYFIVLDSDSYFDSCSEGEQMRELALPPQLIEPFPGDWHPKQMRSAKLSLGSRLSSR